MIKAVIFDNNGVLTSCDADYTCPKFAEYFGIDNSIVGPTFNKLVEDADFGRETTDEFFVRLCHELNVNDDTTELWKMFRQGYAPKPGMREILEELKNKYKIALLTNFIDAFDYFNENVWHYDDLFDQIFVSSKLGMVKPNADIYRYALEKLGVKPEEAVFVDDRQNNIDAAEKLGIKGLLFKDVDQFKTVIYNAFN